MSFWIVCAVVILLTNGCAEKQPKRNNLYNDTKFANPGKNLPSVPPVLCEIRMNSWCILNVGMQVEKSEQENKFIWYLNNTYFSDGPIIISEDKICDSVVSAVTPKKISEQEDVDEYGKRYLVFKYQFGMEKKCTLAFQLPILGEHLKPLYRSSLLTSIKLCDQQNCNVSLNDLEKK